MNDAKTRHNMPLEHNTPPPEGKIPPEFVLPEEYVIPPEPSCGMESATLPPEVQNGGASTPRKPKRRQWWQFGAAFMMVVLAIVSTYSPSSSSSPPYSSYKPGKLGGPLTIRFYYGGAEYGAYKEGWIDVGDVDTDAGRFYALGSYIVWGNNGEEPTYYSIEGDIDTSDRTIEGVDESVADSASGYLFYDVKVKNSSDFSVALPPGPSYNYPGNEYSEPFSVEFASWMIRVGKDEYVALSDYITSENAKDAVETSSDGKSYIFVSAAFKSEIVDKNNLTYESVSGEEYPSYALILNANGGTFEEDGSDILYICPRSLEFSGQNEFFVEATCPIPVNGDKVFAGWYDNEKCKGERITCLNVFEDLKENPYGAAPYEPMEVYAKWVSADEAVKNTEPETKRRPVERSGCQIYTATIGGSMGLIDVIFDDPESITSARITMFDRVSQEAFYEDMYKDGIPREAIDSGYFEDGYYNYCEDIYAYWEKYGEDSHPDFTFYLDVKRKDGSTERYEAEFMGNGPGILMYHYDMDAEEVVFRMQNYDGDFIPVVCGKSDEVAGDTVGVTILVDGEPIPLENYNPSYEKDDYFSSNENTTFVRAKLPVPYSEDIKVTLVVEFDLNGHVFNYTSPVSAY